MSRIKLPFGKKQQEAFDRFAADGTAQRTAGLYTIYVGLSQPDERSAELLQQRPCALCLEMLAPYSRREESKSYLP